MILINCKTKVIVQGITGHHGAFHTKIMLNYGTKIVAGVTPGKGGKEIEGVPVYNTVKEALKEHKATYSIIFVPAPNAKAAACEALQNKLNIVLITEHMPVHDVIAVKQEAQKRKKIMIGPNSPGIICPDEIKISIVPHKFFMKGHIGVISRSGTLTYEIVNHLTEAKLGQSTVIGIGGDAINGFSFIDALKHFKNDKETKAIVLVGEIGGTAEEDVAEYIKKTNYIKKYKKQIVAYIAGIAAPPGKRMGHAGALIQGNKGTAVSKIKALKSAGVTVVKLPKDIILPLKTFQQS
jgi:succinyl-CoA synthetase alpha subunit